MSSGVSFHPQSISFQRWIFLKIPKILFKPNKHLCNHLNFEGYRTMKCKFMTSQNKRAFKWEVQVPLWQFFHTFPMNLSSKNIR
jgi:hypothetical protein